MEIVCGDLTVNSSGCRQSVFAHNAHILNNTFEPRHTEAYLQEAFAYVSFVYQRFFHAVAEKFASEPGFVQACRQDFRPPQRTGPPVEVYPIELDGLADFVPFGPEEVSAVCLVPQAVDYSQFPQFLPSKVMVGFIMPTLDVVPLAKIRVFLSLLQRQLRCQNIQPAEIEISLVDHFGCLCFGMPYTAGTEPDWIWQQYQRYTPSLWTLLVYQSPHRVSTEQDIIRQFLQQR